MPRYENPLPPEPAKISPASSLFQKIIEQLPFDAINLLIEIDQVGNSLSAVANGPDHRSAQRKYQRLPGKGWSILIPNKMRICVVVNPGGMTL